PMDVEGRLGALRSRPEFGVRSVIDGNGADELFGVVVGEVARTSVYGVGGAGTCGYAGLAGLPLIEPLGGQPGDRLGSEFLDRFKVGRFSLPDRQGRAHEVWPAR